MIYEVSESTESVAVEVREVTNGIFDVRIDGKTMRIEATKDSGTAYSLICENEQWEAIADKRRGDKFDITIGGRLFSLEVVDQRKKLLAEAGSGPAVSGPQTVLAEMPGKVAKLEVARGDRVTAGQVIMIIEAMKTFNPIKCQKAGKIEKILVNDSEPVEFGQPLVAVSYTHLKLPTKD